MYEGFRELGHTRITRIKRPSSRTRGLQLSLYLVKASGELNANCNGCGQLVLALTLRIVDKWSNSSNSKNNQRIEICWNHQSAMVQIVPTASDSLPYWGRAQLGLPTITSGPIEPFTPILCFAVSSEVPAVLAYRSTKGTLGHGHLDQKPFRAQ